MSLNSPDAYLNVNNANLRVFGNVHTNQVHLGNMTVRPSYGLSTVTDVSNTTPDTIQFTNTHTAFTTTGNVTVGKDLTVSGNVEVGTANLFVDTVNSRVGIGTAEPSGQLELVGDSTTQEYPPRAITVLDYYTHIEGHGKFEFHASTTDYAGNASWDFTKVFENTAPSTVGWHGYLASISSPGMYEAVLQYAPAVTSGDGVRKTTLTGGSIVYGEWIEMRSPYAINITRVATAPRINYGNSRGIGKFALLGSNNGVDWESVGNGTVASYNPSSSTDAGGYGTYGSETIAQVSINSNGRYYTHHRLVVTHIMGHRGATGHPNYSQGGTEMVNVSYLRFFGTPGSTTLDKGSLTLGRTLDVPRVSRYDVDTETPRPEKLVVDFDTTHDNNMADISGHARHGELNGASYSAADRAFIFDGSNDYIYLEQTDISGTSATQTWSLWFKSDVGMTNNEYHAIFEGGIRSTNQAFGAYLKQVGSNLRVFYHRYGDNLPDADDGHIVTPNRWYHIAGTTDMSGSVSRFYVDGVQIAQDTYSSFNITHPRVRIGSNVHGGEFYKGVISNFKLYNVALEPSEISKLYKLGRTGRSMVITDTAVGIGKVPETQLDVRGSAAIAGYLGIGTKPGDSFGGALHVAGRHGEGLVNGSRRYFKYDVSMASASGGARGSIYALYDIVSSRYFISTSGTAAASDERIKKNIIDVDDSSALDTLRLLKPKKYQYRDTVERGTEPVWGFIAQEVRDTLPYATHERSDFVPNIYQLADVSDSNVITFSEFNTSELEDSTILKVMSSTDEEHEVRIIETIDDTTIRVNTNLDGWTGSVDDEGNVVSGNKIFVYGQKVDDFVFVKKDAIWTIATAALQEVDRQLQAERARNDALEARIEALENAS